MATIGDTVLEPVVLPELSLPEVVGVAVADEAAWATGLLVEDNAAVTPLHAESIIIEISTKLVSKIFLFMDSSCSISALFSEHGRNHSAIPSISSLSFPYG
jgi:hypothetical protein